MKQDVVENMMKRVAEGDKMAFDKLFFMYYPKILNYLSHFISSKEQSEDMAQDFFINLWRNRHFLETVKNPDGYFFISSRNMALNYLKKVRYDSIDIDECLEIPSELAADKEYEAFETDLLVKLIADAMPAQRRRIFYMSRYDGLSNSEIASRLGISKKTVENQINRALKELRKLRYFIFLIYLWVQAR